MKPFQEMERWNSVQMIAILRNEIFNYVSWKSQCSDAILMFRRSTIFAPETLSPTLARALRNLITAAYCFDAT